MKKTFTAVTFNQPDAQGDIFLPGSIKSIKTVGGSVVILHDFDPTKIVGNAERVQTTEKELKITADIKDEYLKMTPAIGFQIIKSEPNEHGGRTIHEINLRCVGLSPQPNADPNIKPLNEQ